MKRLIKEIRELLHSYCMTWLVVRLISRCDSANDADRHLAAALYQWAQETLRSELKR